MALTHYLNLFTYNGIMIVKLSTYKKIILEIANPLTSYGTQIIIIH